MSSDLAVALSAYTIYGACHEINERIFGEDTGDGGEYGIYGVVTIDNKDDIIHQEVDDYVNRLTETEELCLLYDFGLNNALPRMRNYDDVVSVKMLLYDIIMERLPETDGYVNV